MVYWNEKFAVAIYDCVMQKIILFFIFFPLVICTRSQQSKIDSIRALIDQAPADTARIDLYATLGFVYRDNQKVDSCIWATKQALALTRKTNYSLQRECSYLAGMQYMLYETGNYTESLEYAMQNLALSEKIKDTMQNGLAHLTFGHDYKELGYYHQSLDHYLKGREIIKSFYERRHLPVDNIYTTLCIAQVYLKLKQFDSALLFTQEALDSSQKKSKGAYILLATRVLGDIYLAQNHDQIALRYYHQYIPDYIKYKEINRDLGFVLVAMARIFKNRNQLDSSIYYAKTGLENALKFNDQENTYRAATILSEYYEGKDDPEAFRYLRIAIRAKDSMLSMDKQKQIQSFVYAEQVREKEIREANARRKTRNGIILTCAAIIASIITFLIWNRIRQLRLKHKMVLEQKESEKLKTKYEKELLELEAKALRAQMNPHFVFNSLNSIKSLINKNENAHAADYLTTFSKLIRTLFQNSDKREVTLHEELETCRFYTQIEKMRFGDKVDFKFAIDPSIDLKDVKVPALILQPFIENAIWHGLVPHESGGTVLVSVKAKNGIIECTIDDDGIGRALSKQYKSQVETAHQSKGIGLTQSRLELDKLLNNREDAIHIIDKVDPAGEPAGTTVVLTFEKDTTS